MFQCVYSGASTDRRRSALPQHRGRERPRHSVLGSRHLRYAFETIQYLAAVSVFQLKPLMFLRAATTKLIV